MLESFQSRTPLDAASLAPYLCLVFGRFIKDSSLTFYYYSRHSINVRIRDIHAATKLLNEGVDFLAQRLADGHSVYGMHDHTRRYSSPGVCIKYI